MSFRLWKSEGHPPCSPTILALVLGDPDIELSLTEIAERTGAPLSSVHREIRRAESAGLVLSRKVGNVRMVRANVDSPYYARLADLLTRAFGVPGVLAEEIGSIDGVDAAYLFGSWAARYAGEPGTRPVGDIDLLVLGRPDRTALYEAAHRTERRLGREVQVTIRDAGWLEHGDGSFHDTVRSRPMLRLTL